MIKNKFVSGVAGIVALSVAGCASTQTQLGGGGSMVTGSAGAAGTQGAAPQLTRCAAPIGAVARLPARRTETARATTDDAGVMIFAMPIEVGTKAAPKRSRAARSGGAR